MIRVLGSRKKRIQNALGSVNTHSIHYLAFDSARRAWSEFVREWAVTFSEDALSELPSSRTSS
ncbi:hypothetical protein, partial [Pseudomonas syringae]|uniref:hypothetical protein n=1 Tax=Pseudomonas syringae TaxID=317 RepID=UPI0021807FBE